jgi:hypothetical protein
MLLFTFLALIAVPVAAVVWTFWWLAADGVSWRA